MTHREQLPSRRQHTVIAFSHNGLSYRAGLGFFSDGRPAEVFITPDKSGSDAETNAHDGAVAISLGLQYGVPLDTLRHAIKRGNDGEASGPLGRLLDLIHESAPPRLVKE